MKDINADKKITIKDIAKKAGVAVCTVSRVLNDNDNVSKKTRKKVENIINEYNFIPNETARNMHKKNTGTVALIIPDLANPFYTELFCGIEEVMKEEGYYIFVCNTGYEHENEHKYIKEMIGRGVDGMIFMSLYHCGEEIFSIVREKIQAVSIQTEVENINTIMTDDFEILRQSMKHLIELGHKKIAFMCYSIAANRDRYRGYIKMLEESGIEVQNEYIVEDKFEKIDGYSAAKHLLGLGEPPTAIQTLNDSMAFGAYFAAMEKGIKIPDDLSIVGIDDILSARIFNPPLTTVRQPIREIGRSAGEILLKNIKSPNSRLAQKIWLPTQLMIRSSTAPPKK